MFKGSSRSRPDINQLGSRASAGGARGQIAPCQDACLHAHLALHENGGSVYRRSSRVTGAGYGSFAVRNRVTIPPPDGLPSLSSSILEAFAGELKVQAAIRWSCQSSPEFLAGETVPAFSSFGLFDRSFEIIAIRVT